MSIPSALIQPPTHNIRQRTHEVGAFKDARISLRQTHSKPKGTLAQKAGLRYENRVGKYLARLATSLGAELHSHVWIEAGGRTYQPDYYLTFSSKSALLVEVKQTWVDTLSQRKKYRQLLLGLGYSQVTTITVCRNLTPSTPRANIIHSPLDLLEGSVWLLRI